MTTTEDTLNSYILFLHIQPADTSGASHHPAPQDKAALLTFLESLDTITHDKSFRSGKSIFEATGNDGSDIRLTHKPLSVGGVSELTIDVLDSTVPSVCGLEISHEDHELIAWCEKNLITPPGSLVQPASESDEENPIHELRETESVGFDTLFARRSLVNSTVSSLGTVDIEAAQLKFLTSLNVVGPIDINDIIDVAHDVINKYDTTHVLHAHSPDDGTPLYVYFNLYTELVIIQDPKVSELIVMDNGNSGDARQDWISDVWRTFFKNHTLEQDEMHTPARAVEETPTFAKSVEKANEFSLALYALIDKTLPGQRADQSLMDLVRDLDEEVRDLLIQPPRRQSRRVSDRPRR